jgi:hypothetical protein
MALGDIMSRGVAAAVRRSSLAPCREWRTAPAEPSHGAGRYCEQTCGGGRLEELPAANDAGKIYGTR